MPTYSTSGTLSVTTFDTRTLIDRAYGALGLTPQQITSEMQQIALDLLALIQNDLMNIGVPRWCVHKETATLVQGSQQVSLPTGTHDLLSAFYRTVQPVTSLATLTASTSAYVYNFGSGNTVQVSNVSIAWPAASFGVTFQTAPDGATWTTIGTSNTLTQSGIIGTVWYDLIQGSAAQYFQIIPTSSANTFPGTSLTVTLGNTPNDLEMYRMNQNDFWNMTNKTFQGRPLQYWYDRQIAAKMDLWPVPDAISAANLLIIWRARQLLDVGTLQQTIEVPPRWYWNIILLLADALSLCTKDADPDKAAVVAQKAQMVNLRTWVEERDKSPVKFQANLRAYTR